jgi:RNA recognition motif-containing protein
LWGNQGGEKKEIQNKEMIMNIYVGNLSSTVTEESIRKAFESFGQVTSSKIIKDKYTGDSRGFAFVEMPVQAQAQEAVRSLNGKELLGQQISVNEARPRNDQGRANRF